MNHFGITATVSMMAVLGVSGCAGSPDETSNDIGEAPNALISPNSLDPRALGAQPVYPGALTPGMLAAGPLAVSSFSSSVLSAIQDSGDAGALSRHLLAYTVGCALDSTQSLTVSWSDAQGSHSETYSGAFGLASGWSTQVPDDTHLRWVSACLIARVNYLGVVVSLSARGSGIAVTDDETASYQYGEGAFWGQVFSSSPAAYACDVTADDDHSRSRDRYCAAGYPDGSGGFLSCGIIQRVGSCDDRCQPQGSGSYYPSCGSSGGAFTEQVLTIYLQ